MANGNNMFAQLGNIQFEGVKGFESFTGKRESNYARHALIGGKPILQRMGTNLEELNITIKLHTAFCIPEQEINKLDVARQNGEIMALVLGTGEVIGNFVITVISRTISRTGPKGELVEAQLDVNLLEAVVNVAKSKAAAARLKAFAIDNVPTMGIGTTPTLSPQLQVMASITTAKFSVNKAQAFVNKLKRGYQNFDRAAKEIKKNIDKANDEVTKAKNLVLQNPTMLAAAANLTGILESTHALGNNVLVTVQPLASVGALSQANDALVNHLPVLSTAASPIAAICAIRKVA